MLCLNTGPKLAKVSVPISQRLLDKHDFLFGEHSNMNSLSFYIINEITSPDLLK